MPTLTTDPSANPHTEPDTDTDTEEHELPSIEALLAATLALMTGYSQALQAELDPSQRLRLGTKTRDNLALLMDHPMLSPGFRQVVFGLRDRWQAMSECTAQAARDCARGHASGTAAAGHGRFEIPAPKRLQ